LPWLIYLTNTVHTSIDMAIVFVRYFQLILEVLESAGGVETRWRCWGGPGCIGDMQEVLRMRKMHWGHTEGVKDTQDALGTCRGVGDVQEALETCRRCWGCRGGVGDMEEVMGTWRKRRGCVGGLGNMLEVLRS
jgi:hypothetical protein